MDDSILNDLINTGIQQNNHKKLDTWTGLWDNMSARINVIGDLRKDFQESLSKDETFTWQSDSEISDAELSLATEELNDHLNLTWQYSKPTTKIWQF